MKRILLNDISILVLIIINSIVIFLSGFGFEPPINYILSFIDNFISILFIAEVLIKIRTYGLRVYFSGGWDIFDFSLVLISFPSLLVFTFGFEFSDLSYLLTLRTLRAFKVFRFFKFIPNIDKLLSGVVRAIKSSVLVLVSFVLYIFVVGVLSHSLFGYSEFFTDPGTSIYSILKIFTLEGWYEIPDIIVEESNTMTSTFFIRLYFIVILLTGGVFGLSLVNSIFVDAMVSDNNDDLEKKVDELKDMIEKLINDKKTLK